MPRRPETEDADRPVAPEDEGALRGEDRFQMDAGAREATHDLSEEQQRALLTQMRRHLESGVSDAEAWRLAYEEIRRHGVPIAREGEEGARRGTKPVQARRDTRYPEPETSDHE